MALSSYSTLDDVRAIVANQIPEGLNLEYKGSSILINRDANALCKTVSAFANSAGGTFIIGIEMDNLAPVRLDDGTPAPSKRDWIFQVINSGTFPPIEAIEVREFATATGTIYVIDVPSSSQAPHQSKDNKYYKRRGSHSEVMEHYEIDDVRNRPKRPLAPLRAELHTQNILAYLRLTNTHETDAIVNLRCEIEANFALGRDSLSMLTERGLRALLPRHEVHFLLGSVVDFLQTPEPAITFQFRYTFHEGSLTNSLTFHMADLNKTAIMTSPLERALEKLGEKIDKASGHLEHLRRSAETMTNMIDGTGLRLSHRTLNTLRNMPQLFDPREFDADGYRIIADIPMDDAYQLNRLLRHFPEAQAKEEYEKIAPDVRERFEKHFKVSFDQ